MYVPSGSGSSPAVICEMTIHPPLGWISICRTACMPVLGPRITRSDWKHDDSFILRYKQLFMYRIHFERVRRVERGFGTLNDPDWRFLSISGAAERQDRLSEWISDVKLVARSVVTNGVHRPAQLA